MTWFQTPACTVQSFCCWKPHSSMIIYIAVLGNKYKWQYVHSKQKIKQGNEDSNVVIVQLLSCIPLYCNPMDCSQGVLVPLSMDSPGKNTGVGCHTLLQGIFLTQGSKVQLLHWQADFYHWATREAWGTTASNGVRKVPFEESRLSYPRMCALGLPKEKGQQVQRAQFGNEFGVFEDQKVSQSAMGDETKWCWWGGKGPDAIGPGRPWESLGHQGDQTSQS